jgi:DNA-binding FrmR family transcriptional regulator
MPHTPEEKKRAIARLRRIRGQADALILAVERGDECSALLQQLAALRGAATGLMAEVLEGHLRDTLNASTAGVDAHVDGADRIGGIMRAIRPYLK